MRTVDIGVFAHNEADGIAAMIEGLARQDILAREDVSARVVVLANGCSDATVERAEAAIARLPAAVPIAVVDLEAGGKSRTWNGFVHRLSRPECEALIFCDADIELPHTDTLSGLLAMLAARDDLAVANSRPVKDIVQRPAGLKGIDRLIAAAGGSLDDWRTAICGQLYALRAPVARSIHLPIGLPVEDGFVRAMVLTRMFAAPENTACIDGLDANFHVYASERSIGGLIRHQTRIVIGSAINAAVFAHLRGLPSGSIPGALADAARDEAWLPGVIAQRLPVWPHGWVPVHFLTKRAAGMLSRRPAGAPRRSGLVLVAGLGFDLIVYTLAQIKMARGVGVGHW